MSEITAIVLARDEERHLADCLGSLRWANETVLLDSGSRDGTIRIAREAGARLAHHDFVNFSVQRQHALGLARTPWVLFVDADERVTPELAAEARRAVASDAVAGYWIPRHNYFWGHRMRGGGWWPDRQLRLLQAARARYDPRRAVHEVADVDGPTACLTAPLVHLNYDTVAELRAKQLAYARLEAERRWREGQPVRRRGLIGQPAREFWRRYVRLGGWRDGPTGVVACGLLAYYELVTLREARRLAAARM